MPVIRSAKKKLKVDIKRTSANKKMRALMSVSVKKAERKPTPESIREAFRIIDKDVKNNIIHKNKASRMKSKLSKLLSKKTETLKSKTIAPVKAKKVKKI